MTTRVASIMAEVGIDDSKFKSGAQGVVNGLDEMTSAFGFTALGALSMFKIFESYVGALKSLSDAAQESAIAQANLESSLKSTGNAAGLTVDDLNKMAYKLAVLTGQDDELVTSAQAVLLTFKAVRKDVFSDVMLAAIDMQAKGFGNLQSNVVQVGKAMSSFTGYTALQRAGVNFNATQLQQIKNFQQTNDLAGYQALVLAELKSQVDGTAAAMNKASDGSARLNLEFGNFKENIGEPVLLLVRDVTTSLANMFYQLNQNAWAVKGLVEMLMILYRIMFAIPWNVIPAASDAVNNNKGNTNQHATGGSFLIPQSYGREGFKLGNGDTASAGERVTITPANNQAGGASVVIGNLTIGDTSNLSRAEITDMIQTAFVGAMGR